MKTKLIKKIMTLTIVTITAIGMLSIGASASWRQNGYGWWNQKGNEYSIGWDKVGSKWYYFNPDGYMRTGWINDGGKWYYLNSNGDMATGWINDGGKWYYLGQNGDMLLNAFINGYILGADGAWVGNNLTNVTTGAAVNITTDSPVDIADQIVNTTTGAAVALPVNNYNNYWGMYNNQNNNLQNYENYVNQYNNDKNKLENLEYKYQQKLEEQAQKKQQKLNQAWWYLRR